MITKCYIVEINSSIEAMFDDLFDADFYDFTYKTIEDSNHIEITFTEKIERITELEEIMKWYV